MTKTPWRPDLFKQFIGDTKAEGAVEALRWFAGLLERGIDFDAATDIIGQLRYVQDGDDWDDQIEDVTRNAVVAALVMNGTRRDG